jgi:hypothetical protein
MAAREMHASMVQQRNNPGAIATKNSQSMRKVRFGQITGIPRASISPSSSAKEDFRQLMLKQGFPSSIAPGNKT